MKEGEGVEDQRCHEVRIGGAAPLFPLVFFSYLPYMVRMLIQPASMAALNPLTPLGLS